MKQRLVMGRLRVTSPVAQSRLELHSPTLGIQTDTSVESLGLVQLEIVREGDGRLSLSPLRSAPGLTSPKAEADINDCGSADAAVGLGSYGGTGSSSPRKRKAGIAVEQPAAAMAEASSHPSRTKQARPRLR